MTDERLRLIISGIVAVALTAAVTILLIVGISPERIIAGFTVIGTVVSVVLLNEVQKVKQNTNGTVEKLQAQVAKLTDMVAKSPPIKE